MSNSNNQSSDKMNIKSDQGGIPLSNDGQQTTARPPKPPKPQS